MQGRIPTHAKPVNCQIAGLCEQEAPAPAPAVASLCISSAHAGLSTYLWMQGPSILKNSVNVEWIVSLARLHPKISCVQLHRNIMSMDGYYSVGSYTSQIYLLQGHLTGDKN